MNLPPAETYELLRTLTSPIVAVTCRHGDKLNGLISDGAIRASIVPDVPRLGVFIHKFNYSHDLIWDTGRFALHVLHTDQVDLVRRFGFVSGRDRDKMAGVPYRIGATGCPILADCYCWFDCRVVNVMDTGSSTFFMGDIVLTGKGPGAEPLAPAALRAQLAPAEIAEYTQKLTAAQQAAREASGRMVSIYTRK